MDKEITTNLSFINKNKKGILIMDRENGLTSTNILAGSNEESRSGSKQTGAS